MDEELKLVLALEAQAVGMEVLDGAARALEHLGAMGKIAAAAFLPIGAGIAAIGVGAGILAEAAGKAAAFDTTITDIANNTGLTNDQVAQLKGGILDLANQTGAPIEQIAHAFEHAMNVTQNYTASIAEAKAGTQSAVSTGADATEVTNMLAGVMHEYGQDVSHAATQQGQYNDILANANHIMGELHIGTQLANTTLDKYTDAQSKAIGIAANMNIPLNDILATTSALTKHGFPDVYQAGVQVTDMLTHMENPSKQAKEALVQLSQMSGDQGVAAAFDAQNLAARGLIGTIDYLRAAEDKTNLTEAEREKLNLRIIPALRGGLGFAAALGTGYNDMNSNLAKLNDTTAVNAVNQESFNRTLETAGGQWNLLKDHVATAQIQLGEGLQPALVKVLGAFNGLFPAIQGAIPTVAAFASHLADELIPKIQQLPQFVTGTVIPAIQHFAGIVQSDIIPAIRNFGTFLGTELIPGVQRFAAYAQSDLIPAIQRAATFVQTQLVPAVQAAAQWVQTSFVPAIEAIAERFAVWGPIVAQVASDVQQFVGAIRQRVLDFTSALNTASDGTQTAWQAIRQAFSEAWAAIQPVIAQAARAVDAFGSEVMPRLEPAIRNVLGFVKDIFATTMDGLQAALTTFETIWAADWGDIRQVLEGVWKIIQGVVEVAWAAVSGVITIGLDLLGGNWRQAWTDYQTMVQTAWDGINRIVDGAKEVMLGIVRTGLSTLVAIVNQFVPDFQQAGRDLIQGLINGIQSMGSAVSGAVGQIVQGAIGAAKAQLGISSPSTVFAGFGQQTMQGYAQGITAAQKDTNAAITAAFADVRKTATDQVKALHTDVAAEIKQLQEDEKAQVTQLHDDAARKIQDLHKQMVGETRQMRLETTAEIRQLRTDVQEHVRQIHEDTLRRITDLRTQAKDQTALLRQQSVQDAQQLQTQVTDSLTQLNTDGVQQFQQLSAGAQAPLAQMLQLFQSVMNQMIDQFTRGLSGMVQSAGTLGAQIGQSLSGAFHANLNLSIPSVSAPSAPSGAGSYAGVPVVTSAQLSQIAQQYSGPAGGGGWQGGGLAGGTDFSTLAGHALGGYAAAGVPIRVGERGEEVFVPDTGGTIIPNNALGAAGGVVVNVYVSGNTMLGQGSQVARELATILAPELKRLVIGSF